MSSPEFKYRGFGLNICSEIGFPELFPADFEQEDIHIRVKPIEDGWFESIDPGHGCQRVDRDVFRLQVPGVGRYLVRHGKELWMEASPNADPSAFRMYALTYAMSACLVQRRLTLLHASGILLNSKVILFAGESGVGKSTIIRRFYQKGYTIFTDDVCVLDGRINENGQMAASASYPLIKLDSTVLARHFPDAHPMSLWPDSEKKGLGFHHTFDAGWHPIACVMVISKDPESPMMKMEHLHGLRAFRKLAECVYRKSLIRAVDQQAGMTRILTTLAGSTPVLSVSRTGCSDDGTALPDLLEELIHTRFQQ
jgi:hypothetical protein